MKRKNYVVASQLKPQQGVSVEAYKDEKALKKASKKARKEKEEAYKAREAFRKEASEWLDLVFKLVRVVAYAIAIAGAVYCFANGGSLMDVLNGLLELIIK